MEGIMLVGLWLRAESYCNGPAWVAIDLSLGSTMFLMRRWKSSARSRSLGLEHLLHFRIDEDAMLTVMFLGSSGSRLECCVESSSGSDLDTSSKSDNDDNSPNARLEGEDSE
ncbi:hypothetical protein D1007_53225 [Hordeum vulgare]|nr:hypothetical protein D1007_53225 [Hordeum vulgare]